jgi:hypothetical protein
MMDRVDDSFVLDDVLAVVVAEYLVVLLFVDGVEVAALPGQLSTEAGRRGSCNGLFYWYL